MAQALEVIDKRHTALETVPQMSPMQELQARIIREGDIDKMKQLMELERQWKADKAREAFVEAMATFKANLPRISKNKHVHFNLKDGGGTVDYWHATLDSVCEVVCPLLAGVGISHHWDVSENDKGVISVTCALTHQLGHKETVTLSAPPDMSGKKNAIQQKGSTITYLERYTFLALVGLATVDQDNDGRGATRPADIQQGEMDEGEALDLIASIEGAGDRDELNTRYFAARDAAEKAHDMRALKAFKDAANKRAQQLKGGR